MSCWQFDMECNGTWDDLPQVVRDRSQDIAGDLMNFWTLGRFGQCRVDVRPCVKGCWPAHQGYWDSGWFRPYMVADQAWVNSCGCMNDCNCSGKPISSIWLPGRVASIVEVTIDGSDLSSSHYRVDNGYELVRIDGEAWPSCQDMLADTTEVGTFMVSYIPGYPISAAGQYAGGLLANEFAKAMQGGKCALPEGVTQIARQGVVMSVSATDFPGGVTGIRYLDAYIASVNPNHLKVSPMAWSPDIGDPRTTTIMNTSQSG